MITIAKCVLTILELNWKQRFRGRKTKLNLSSYADVVHTTAKQVISRHRKNEKVFKMSKDEKCTCKACKNTVFHCQTCKFVGFLLPSSSWLFKLPNKHWRSRKEFPLGFRVKKKLTGTVCAMLKNSELFSGSHNVLTSKTVLASRGSYHEHQTLQLCVLNEEMRRRVVKFSTVRSWSNYTSRKLP